VTGPRVLELMGPSGIGKTTIGRLAAGHAPDGVEFRLKPASDADARGDEVWRLSDLLRAVWYDPRLARRVLWVAICHGRPFRRRLRKAVRLVHYPLDLERWRRATPGHTLVLDEGFLQKLWALVVESERLRATTTIEKLLADHYRRSGVRGVLLDAGETLVAERVFARTTRGRFSRDSGAALREAYPRWVAQHRTLVALLPDGTLADTVDTRAGAEAAARQLCRSVEQPPAPGAHT
jgi:hypothetical protein